MKLRSVACVLALALIASPALATEGSLNWQFEEGDTFDYKMVKTETTSMAFGGQSFDITQEQTFYLGFEVKSVNEDGAATLGMTHDRLVLRISNKLMGKDIVWDSADGNDGPAGNPMAGALGKLVGLEATLVVEPRGHISEVSGYESIVKEIEKSLESAPGMGGQLGQLGIGGEISKTLGNEGFRVLFQRAIVETPEGLEVQAGDTWTNVLRYSFPLAGQVALTLNNTFEGQEGNTATINFDGSAELVEGAQSESPLAAFMDITFGDSTISGTEKFNTELGRVQQTTFESSVTLKLKAKAGNGGGGGMGEQSVQQSEKVQFELIEEGAAEEGAEEAPEKEEKEGGKSEPRSKSF